MGSFCLTSWIEPVITPISRMRSQEYKTMMTAAKNRAAARPSLSMTLYIRVEKLLAENVIKTSSSD
jgi:hypothetical protein